MSPRRPGRLTGTRAALRTGSAVRDRLRINLDTYTPHAPASQASQSAALHDLLFCIVHHGLSCNLVSLVAAPRLLAGLVLAFGRNSFRLGKPLYAYLCLVTSLERLSPDLRAVFGQPWLATDLRIIEPAEHRLPTPASLFRAMLLLAWSAGWTRWAGVTMIAYVGPGRMGEVLRAKRACLVLPSDNLGEHSDRAFLRVPNRKSGNRGGASVQHITVVGHRWVRILALW